MRAKTTTAAEFTLSPLVVAVDQREKAPFSFTEMKSILKGCGGERRLVVRVERKFLQTGDYSIIGYEDRVGVERKELSDLYSTIGQNRERFEAEFERLNAMEVAAVMIEATWGEVQNPTAARGLEWRSKLLPKSVFGTIQQWIIRYPRVHWFAPGDRRAAEKGTYLFLERYYREVNENARREKRK